MGGFNFNIPGINFNPQMLQNIQQGTALASAPTLTGMAANFNPASGPLTDEARVAQAQADAETRQFLIDEGVDVQGLSLQEYEAAKQALGWWRNLPENRGYRDQKGAFGKFVDSIGGVSGLFALTLGAFTGGLGLLAMPSAMGLGAAAGGVSALASGEDPVTAALAGAGGGLLGGGANALLAGAPSAGAGSAGLSGISAPTAGSLMAPSTAAAAGGGTSAINLGAAGLGAAAPAVSTTAPLTMGGLLGGTSPAAGAINLGAAGLGTAAGAAGLGAAGAAAGGTGMGGISGLISGAGNLASSVGNFVGSPLGQGLLGLGQAGLGYFGQQEQADLARELAAQAQFRPYNVAGPLGNVTVEGQQINISPTQQQAALQQQLFGLTGGALGRAQDPALMNIFQQAPGQLQQLTQQFIGQETAIPGAAQALQQQLGALGGEALGMGRGLLGQAQNLPSAMGAVSPLVGGAPLARSPEEALTSQAAGAGLGLLGEGAAGARSLTGTLAGTGGELLRGAAGGAPSFNQLASERLASLRASARPAEERTTQAALERLYSQGRLGTTGGQRALGELARAQEEADIARTIAAQDFAQQQQNVLANQAIQRGQLGLSALGGALGGQQFLTGTGTNLLGMGTQVGQFGRTLQEQARGMDINTLLAATGQDVAARMGQAGLGQGLFGLGAQLPSTIFGAQQAADQAALSRGAQRIAAAEGLFGFGQQARTGELGMGLQAMQAQQAQFNPLIQLANIASGMGSAQALGAARGADLQYGAFGSPYTAASTYLGSLIG